MRVALRDGGAVSGEAPARVTVRGDERCVHVALLARKVAEQGRTEIEAHVRVVRQLATAQSARVVRKKARLGVGPVTIPGDALVPVVGRRGAGMGLDTARPRVLARGLV